MSCSILTDDIKKEYQILGDYDCDGKFTFDDLISFIALHFDIEGGITTSDWFNFDKLLEFIALHFDMESNIIDRDTWNINNLGQIRSSQDSQPQPQPQSQTTLERAQSELSDIESTGFGIANIPINDGSGKYDIFFKGKEVLEYKANLNGYTPSDPVACNLLSDSRTAFQKGTWYTLTGQCLTRDPDYAKFDITAITAGTNIELDDLTNIFISISNRDKEQKAFVASGTSTLGNPTSEDTFNLYELETDYLSLRTDHKTFLADQLTTLSIGVDFQETDYSKKSSQSSSLQFGGFVNASQESRAIYSQNSINLNEGNSIMSFGARLENADYKVRESFDKSVSKYASSSARDPYQTKMSNHAVNIGIEHILDNQNRLFAKCAPQLNSMPLEK